MSRSNLRRELGWAVLAFLVTVQLRLDVLGILDPAYKAAFQQDSDALVVNRLTTPGLGPFAALVLPDGGPYLSQFGLQGMVMAAIAPGESAPVEVYRWTSCALLAVLLVAAARGMSAVSRGWAGFALLALLVLAPWLNAFGPSLYWQTWTLLLPTVVPLLVWPPVAARSRWLGWGLVAALVGFKALSGYEYITTVILGAVAAVAFHELRGRLDRRLVLQLVAAMAAGIVGFGAAMAVHVVQSERLYGDVSGIESRSSMRTFAPVNLDAQVTAIRDVDGPFVDLLMDLNEPLGVWAHRMEFYLYDTAVATPGGAGLGPSLRLPVWVFVLGFLVLVGLQWRRGDWSRLPDEAWRQLERRLLLAAGIGLVGALSWLVLAYGHMINHPHIDAIVFFLPFLPFLFAVLALRLQTWWAGRRGTG